MYKRQVTGRTRREAIERARRALGEYVVAGFPTVIPFHQAILANPAFVGDEDGFSVYTRWIEEEWDGELPSTPATDEDEDADTGAPARRTFAVEIDGRRIEVALPEELVAAGPAKRKPKKRRANKAAVSGDAVASPMQASVIKVNVEEGQEVAEGDVLLVLEAMKMENPVKAHKAGAVTGLAVEVGGQVNKGAVLMELK